MSRLREMKGESHQNQSSNIKKKKRIKKSSTTSISTIPLPLSFIISDGITNNCWELRKIGNEEFLRISINSSQSVK